MTKEMKYGILALAALLLLVPVSFLAIKAGAFALGFIFNQPATALAVSVAFVAGMIVNEKLSK